jgi:hypothetical protein
LQSDQTNPVAISTGGGIFKLTVMKSPTEPLTGVNCYVFSQAGSYLGLSGITSSEGLVSFPLADGNYKIRVDYLGSQFWTQVYNVPNVLTGEFTITHKDITIGVNGVYQETSTPVTGINVYLFSESGSYLGQSKVTGNSGSATFNLPEQPYKVRADYLGMQFWSDNFIWQNATVAIQEGTADIHVVNGNTDVTGARVYAFSSSGSYLGLSTVTDSAGKAGFVLPSGTFKFRVDALAQQIWSDPVSIPVDVSTSVLLNFSNLPTITLSASLATITQGGSSVLSWNSTNATSVMIDNGIGNVDLNGSISVSPQVTTTYTITATGPGGSVAATATVTVNNIVPIVGISANPMTIPSGGSSVLTWNSANATSVTIDNGIGNVDLNGSISVSPEETTTYAIVANGPGGSVTGSVAISVNKAPNITVIKPDGVNSTADEGFKIKWTDSDPDSNAAISLYYDTDNHGADGVLIASSLNEDDDGSNGVYYWNTAAIPEGECYIYAVINDGINDPVVSYSDSVVKICHGPHLIENKITPSDLQGGEEFGSSVAISGDYAIVGAPENNTGSVYVYKRNGDIWVQSAKIIPSGGESSDRFGSSVAISGDYVIIGAYYDDNVVGEGSKNYSGSAYIFKLEGDAWIEKAKLVADDAGYEDGFGASVAINGDYAVAGAPYNDTGSGSQTRRSGAAYIFKHDGDSWVQSSKFVPYDGRAQDEFGSSVSINGDYAVVGAPYADMGGVSGDPDSGAVYVFKKSEGTWIFQTKLTGRDEELYDYFGSAVSIGGNYIVVGSTYNNSGSNGIENYSGSAYVFKKDGYNWIEKTKFAGSDSKENDKFGAAVSISGDYAIVGAPNNDTGNNGSVKLTGSAYLFKRNGESWKEQAKFSADDIKTNDGFGGSVSITKNYIAVGVPGSDVGGYGGEDAGSAYIFKINNYAEEISVEINADSQIINAGGSATLSWISQGADSVSIDHGIGVVASTGSRTVSPTETTTYTITASGPNGNVTGTITINVLNSSLQPTVHINASSLSLTQGKSVSLAWTSTNAYSCSIEPDIGKVDVNGTVSVSPENTTTYIITATGPAGSAVDSVTVTVNYVEPDVEISVYPETINSGGYAWLDVWSSHASSVSIDQGIGEVELNDSIFINPQATTTYTVTATGPGGTATASVTVVVNYPEPEINFWASQTTIPEGGSSVLRWEVEGTESVVIDQGIGPVDLEEGEGSISVSPSETTTYTITATNPGGSVSKSVTVVVNRSPSISITQPLGSGNIADEAFEIKWSANDSDNNAQISLYYDTDNSGADGVKIVDGLSEDESGSTGDYYWDTSDITNGSYYVYASISDGINVSKTVYSNGSVTIQHQTNFSGYKIIAEDGMGYDQFGNAVSINGDYAIVGAHQKGSGSGGLWSNGSAYIFKLDGSLWAEQAEFIPSDAQSYSEFGSSVSLSGAYAIVGAPYNFDLNNGGEKVGSAYIFMRNQDAWTEQIKLIASNAKAKDEFGNAVAISGKYAIVGAHLHDGVGGKADSGAAYIFLRNGDAWSQQTELTASDAASLAEFGSAVSISGSYAVVGAPYVFLGGKADTGAAYIFKRDGEIWSQQVKLTPKDADAYDEFGTAVSISGEYAIIGSHYDDSANGGKSNSGAAYIFKRDGAGWTQQAKLMAADAGENDEFGSAVSINGDYAVVGSHYHDGGISGEMTDSGAIYIFKRDGDNWFRKAKIVASDGDSFDEFGSAVASNGNYAIAGAPYDETGGYGGEEEGSAYIFKIADDNSIETKAHIAADSVTINIGGFSTLSWSVTGADAISIDQGIGAVAASGSIQVSPLQTTTYTITASGPDSDVSSSATVVVVDPSVPPLVKLTASPVALTQGQSSVLTWTSSNAYSCSIEPGIGNVDISGSISVSPPEGATTYTITAIGGSGKAVSRVVINVTTESHGSSSGSPGGYVSINGDYAISGSTVFKRQGSTWPVDMNIDKSGPVSMSSDYMIVGDTANNELGTNAGAAYIYKREGSSWVKQTEILASNGKQNDSFGWSVAINGQYAVVGAPYSGSEGNGSVYIFKRSGDAWAEMEILSPGDLLKNAYFGSSVAINGGYLAVGADGDLNALGSVYVYKLDGDIWIQQNKLICGESEEGKCSYFGESVSISNNNIAVGAVYSSQWPYSGSGTVYLFRKQDSNWIMDQRIEADDLSVNQDFGYSISLNGDYILVGAPGDAPYLESYGAAYLFKRGIYGWQQFRKIIEPVRQTNSKFGKDVAMDGSNVIISSAAGTYIFPVTTLNVNVSSKIILAGGSTSLSWDFANADSVTIDHGIGTFYGNGSVTISPTETTTYTITVSYQGQETVYSVTVYVVNPSIKPSVTIYPVQTVIRPGQSVDLYWNATNALSCSIDQGVGQVNINDSITVAPETTTTYTITATGPAGTATTKAKVIVKPTVEISAAKTIIHTGASTTLAWTSRNADTCTITPDVGTVVLNGSATVTPSGTTTYTITATGEGGTATATVTITTVTLDINIESPLDGATINRPDVMVRGTITNIPDCETGVTVNGVGALVYFNGTTYEFAANHIPLEEGENEITVSVKDTDGNTKTATITVDAEVKEGDNYITLTPYEETGVSPFNTTFKLEGTFGFILEPEITTSDYYVNISKNPDEYTYNTTISNTGLRYVTATTQYNGNIYSDSVALLVTNQTDVDTIIKSQWNGFKEALRTGKIEDALQYFNPSSRDEFGEIFNILSDELPAIVDGMENVNLVSIDANVATYEIEKDEIINGETQKITYSIDFVRDAYGKWYIDQF